MRSFTLYFLPAIAVSAVVFGLFYGWVGIQSLGRGEVGVGIFLLVFGFGGIALGVAMLSACSLRPSRDQPVMFSATILR